MRILTRTLIVAAALVMSSSALPAQTPATRQVMRAKLSHAERVLDALMLGDFRMMEGEANALVVMTKSPGWTVLKSERYARYSETFMRTAENIVDAAKRRDGDDAMHAYVSMTLACYSCHRYVSESRIAK